MKRMPWAALAALLAAGCVRLDARPVCRAASSPAPARLRAVLPEPLLRIQDVAWDGSALPGSQAGQEWTGELPKGVDWKTAHRVRIVTDRWAHESEVPVQACPSGKETFEVIVWVEDRPFWTWLGVPYGFFLSCLGLGVP